MKIGYARVSTKDQTLDLQIDALKAEGIEEDNIYTDTASGAKTERPGLDKCLQYMRKGDVLTVYKLDRLGRNLRHLTEFVNDLNDKGIDFRSVKENIDTTTSTGKLIFHIFASIAEFERDLIRERTKAGLEAARARGRKGGRRRKLSHEQWIKMKKQYEKDKSLAPDDIMKLYDIKSKSTLYKYLNLDEYPVK